MHSINIYSITNGSSPFARILINGYMPLILGHRLPERVRTGMIAGLKNESFFTKWGLATESTESGFYIADGYWRGPI